MRMPLTKIKNVGEAHICGKDAAFLDLVGLRCLWMMSEGKWIDGSRAQQRDWTRYRGWEVASVAIKIETTRV